MKIKYLTCQICGCAVRIRKDGKFPVHGKLRPRTRRTICMGSECYP